MIDRIETLLGDMEDLARAAATSPWNISSLGSTTCLDASANRYSQSFAA